jgi:hypothetical protein
MGSFISTIGAVDGKTIAALASMTAYNIAFQGVI